MRKKNGDLHSWAIAGIVTLMTTGCLVLAVLIYKAAPVISYVLMGDANEWRATRVEYQVCGNEERNEKTLYVCHTEYRSVRREDVYR